MTGQNPRLRWPWILLALFLLLLGAAGGALYYGPEYLRGLAEEKLTLLLKRQVTVGKVIVAPLDQSLAVERVVVLEPDGSGEFFSFARFSLALDASSSFRRRAVVVKSCRLEQPRLHLVRRADGGDNFSDLLEPTAKEEKGARPLPFMVSNIELAAGALEFDDQIKKTVHRVAQAGLAIPLVSNFPEQVDNASSFGFSALVNGSSLAVKGGSKPFAPGRESEIELTLDGLNLPDYLPYLPPALGFTLESGKLSAKLALSLARKAGGEFSLQAGGGVDLRDLALADRNRRTFFSLARLDVALEPSALLTRQLKLGRVAFSAPVMEFDRLPDGGIYPLSLLLPLERAEGPTGKSEAGPPWQVTVKALLLDAAAVRFSDQTTKPVFKCLLAPVALQLHDLSLSPGSESRFKLQLAGDGGETLGVEGQLLLEPLALSGQLALGGVELVRFAPYYQNYLAGKVSSGRLKLDTGFAHAAGGADPKTTLSNLGLELSALILKEKNGSPFLNLPLLKLSGGSCGVGERTFSLAEILLKEGKISAALARDGQLNLTGFLPAAPSPPPAKEKKNNLPRAAGPENSWQGRVEKLTLQNFTVNLQDLRTEPPVTTAITGLTVKARDISTQLKKPFPLSLTATLNQSGKLELTGELTPEPLRARLNVGLKELALRPFMPYLAEQVNLSLNGGDLSLRGGLEFQARGERAPRYAFTGDAGLSRVRVMDGEGEELVSLGALGMTGIALAGAPLRLTVEELALRDFWTKIIISREKKLNLSSLVKERAGEGEGAAAAKPGETGAAPDGEGSTSPEVAVKRVLLDNGRVEFHDRSLSPGFSSRMSELSGSISGLDTRVEAEAAQVELRGKHDGSAPLLLTGTIRPRPDRLYAQLQLALTGVDLTAMTPYTAKYLGRTTDKGKLSLDLRYLIDRRQLTSENKALLDQFTLGRTVESAEATTLPIGLALALLTNRKGEITLDLPVTGSLDDPEFSLGRIIWKMLFNLIAKAVTSPFALLGSLIPKGSPDLEFVAFPPGGVELAGAETEKLAAMAKILDDRPGLRVDLTGYGDRAGDTKALAAQAFARLLVKAKVKELLAGGEVVARPEEVTVAAGEYEKYLQLAYRAASIVRPKNAVGLEKALPPAEQERLLRDSIQIGEEELRELAGQRANRVREYLLASGEIDPGRIFLVEAKVVEEGEERPGSRVELAVK